MCDMICLAIKMFRANPGGRQHMILPIFPKKTAWDREHFGGQGAPGPRACLLDPPMMLAMPFWLSLYK